jgi:fanconi-associated nuclease 1
MADGALECLGGSALATICLIQAENYAGTGGGVPDLILWHVKDRSAKFVEVKSPNDRPSEKQKVCAVFGLTLHTLNTSQTWIDAMVRAGINVEICNVFDPNDEADSKEKKDAKKRRSQTRTPGKKRVIEVESEDEDELYSAAGEDDELLTAPVSTSKTRKRKRRDTSPEY